MKPSETQKEICKIIIKQVNYWHNTNDIYSCTHHGDLQEELENLKCNISYESKQELERRLFDLLVFIRTLPNDK